MGAAFPAVVKEAKTVLFPIEEKKMRNNADGHVLVVSDYEPGADYVYYWGFAWDRADIKTAEAWNRYMADFAQKVRNPLTVSIHQVDFLPFQTEKIEKLEVCNCPDE